MTKSSINNLTLQQIKDFFEARPILKHFVLIGLAFLFILLTVIFWLRFYTNHGEKIEMPDYIGQSITQVKADAEERSFEIVVTDSVFVVGKSGGEIINQNPKPKSWVKSGRKIYVVITKFDPDKITVAELPILYGNEYNQKKNELAYRGIECVIRGKKYDPGEPNHILEVYYNNELIIDSDVFRAEIEIDKGGVLEFVLSDTEGGELLIPDLRCKRYTEAEFLLQSSKLLVGFIEESGNITAREDSYIIAQDPVPDGITKIKMGSVINLVISQSKPSNCN